MAEEVEIGLVEGAGKPRRVGGNHLKAKVAAEPGQIGGPEHLIERLEKIRLADIEAGELRQAKNGEIDAPIEIRGKLLER